MDCSISPQLSLGSSFPLQWGILEGEREEKLTGLRVSRDSEGLPELLQDGIEWGEGIEGRGGRFLDRAMCPPKCHSLFLGA